MSTSPVVIVNPQSGGGRTRRAWPRLEAAIRDALGDFRPVFTERSGHAIELTRAALREGADLVIAMGGDGTINEVVNGFFDEQGAPIRPSAAFGLLPAGTGGDFVKTAGTPATLIEAARHIASARPRAIDVGRLTYLSHDAVRSTRMFINIASFGIGGLIDRYVESSKSLGGKAGFFVASVRATLVYHNTPVRITVDDQPPEVRTIYSVAVAKGRFFGGGMMIAPPAELDSGRFEVVTIGDVGLTTMLRYSPRIYAGTHLTLPFIQHQTARKLYAESTTGEEVLLDVDGEPLGRLPATFEILPRAIQVMAP